MKGLLSSITVIVLLASEVYAFMPISNGRAIKRSTRSIMAKKIDDEFASMASKGTSSSGGDSNNKGKRGKRKEWSKGGESNDSGNISVATRTETATSTTAVTATSTTTKTETEVVEKEEEATTTKETYSIDDASEESAVFTSAANEVIFANAIPAGSGASGDEKKESQQQSKQQQQQQLSSSGQEIMTVGDQPLRVPKKDPLRQSVVPPEVVFFGEPRRPPPVEASRDTKYHGSLLFWARHATVAPRTSEERLESVFPRGRLCPQALKYRLNSAGLTFENILKGFESVMDDLEASKQFINSNIDLVPSKMFLRALTAQKLSAQSKDDLERMDHLKDVRRKYIVAHDQLFFPLNLELQKAETRVMTFMARDELRDFARNWDEVEMSLHFTTLLAARLTWDDRVRDILDSIKTKVVDSVDYMQKNLQAELMTREFRKPGLTAEMYTNASAVIQNRMPELYKRIRPEIRFLTEIYFSTSEDELNAYVKPFCAREGISPDQLKEGLRIYDASLAAIQGIDYTRLRLFVGNVANGISDASEKAEANKWYLDLFKNGYGFETYEPDNVPTMVALEQRIRPTESAFDDFFVQVLKRPTKYTNAFAGKRQKGSEVGNWLNRDPEFVSPNPASYEERIEEFRQAYISQTQLRKDAETKLERVVAGRMDAQDRALMGGMLSKVFEFDEEL